MAQNTKPIFALTPETTLGVITTATTDKSGATTTNLIEVVEAATNGTKVTQVKYKHVGNSTAGTFLLFISDTSGSNLRLHSESPFVAVTSSNTVATAEGTLFFRDLQLKAGQKIVVGATTATSDIHVTVSIGNF